MAIPRAAQTRSLFLFRVQILDRSRLLLNSFCQNAPRRGYAARARQVSALGRPSFVKTVGLISTLNPDKITSKDYLEFPREARCVLRTSANATMTMKRRDKIYTYVSNRISLFPRRAPLNAFNKPGFLYYHQEVAENPISGGLRFRLADYPSITAFHDGKDLISSQTDLPWRLPLLQISKSSVLSPLLAQLMQDGLVTKETVSKCRQLTESNQRIDLMGRQAQIIYSLNEPFMINFDEKARTVHLLEGELGRIRSLQSLSMSRYPYTGKCIVRFEEVTSRMSTTAEPPANLVKFRVIKIVEPLRWRNSALHRTERELPKEGSLIGYGVRLVDQCYHT